MNTFLNILVAGLFLFIIWGIYKQMKGKPDLLSKENMSKSFSTMGILALCLIATVAGMVLLLRH